MKLIVALAAAVDADDDHTGDRSEGPSLQAARISTR